MHGRTPYCSAVLRDLKVFKRSQLYLVAAASFALSTGASAASFTLLTDTFDEEAPTSAASFGAPDNFAVSQGSVDFVSSGQNGVACAGGGGGCLDLDGSLATAGTASKIESSVLTFLPGFTYTLTFDYSGNQRVGTSQFGATAGQVFRLYQATLDRNPDGMGFSGWNEQLADGRSLQAITSGFVNSIEFRSKYGAVDNTAFVTLLYNNVLNRSPDAAGLAGWIDALDKGATREQIVLGFSESPEFQTNTSAALQTFLQTPAGGSGVSAGAVLSTGAAGVGATDGFVVGIDGVLSEQFMNIAADQGFTTASIVFTVDDETQSRLSFLTPGDADFIGAIIDNISLTGRTLTNPLPAGLPLLLTGLAGFGALGLRRRKAASI
jgi:hypothetical protein